MKVLITGGTGFIGSRLALRCKEREYDVKALGLSNTLAEAQNTIELKRNGVQVAPVDLLDRDGLARELSGVDVVYHLAAAQHEMNVPDQHFRDVNVDGTRNMIESAIEAGVSRFVHGSTIGVYGIIDGRIDESTPCNPENIYGVTKLEGEKLALSYKQKLPVVVIRIPEVYGPGDRRLLKLFKLIGKNKFFMIGSGKNLHHLIYIDDLIQAFCLASEKDSAVGEVFLLAGAKPVSTNEMVETIATHLGAKGSLFRVPFGPVYGMAATMETILRPIGIQPPLHRRRMDFFKKSFNLSWDKAADLLNYHPKVSFSEGMLETARWYVAMKFIENSNPKTLRVEAGDGKYKHISTHDGEILPSKFDLTAKIEPFDSFWEAPDDVEKGYGKFATFYKYNYLNHFPADKNSRILDVSCGPGYMVNLLNQNGYINVTGIDAMPDKVFWAKSKKLNCEAARAFDFLHDNTEPYDVVFCEQEINHLTKNEILDFLQLCRQNLKAGGKLIIHSLNGANPIVGSENLALNFDHYNTFTEKSLEQVLEHVGFRNIRILPLKLYVFYRNPLNYVGITIDAVLGFLFKYIFKFYGKSNKIFTKKIAAVCTNPQSDRNGNFPYGK
jgi:nucleoside-diphosphate-sugar epimerase/2-polyprenyl-3-methyl-5-hydroxy-6-metoxy-1,4-benzoquinol methylase